MKGLILLIICLYTSNVWGQGNKGQLTISYIEGEVEVLKEKAKTWEKAKLYSYLTSGDRIRTKFGAKAELKFPDGSIIRMEENTVLEIKELIKRKEKEVSSFKMMWGKLKARIKRLITKESSVNFYTPTAVIGLRGTIFELRVDIKTGETLLKVLEGKVFFRPIGIVEEIGVEEGESCETKDGKTYTKEKIEKEEKEKLIDELFQEIINLLKKNAISKIADLEIKLKDLKEKVDEKRLPDLFKIEGILGELKEKVDRAEKEEELLSLINEIERLEERVRELEERPKVVVVPIKLDYQWLTKEKFVNFIPTCLIRIFPENKPIIVSIAGSEFRLETPPYILRYKPYHLSTGINEIHILVRFAEEGAIPVPFTIETPYYDPIKPIIISARLLVEEALVKVNAFDRESGLLKVSLDGQIMNEIREGIYEYPVKKFTADRVIIKAEDKAGNVTTLPLVIRVEDWPPPPPD
jgi:hypothetical protein